jgi:1-acyl-sn-glycerol-3-phosphate acyltransferase
MIQHKTRIKIARLFLRFVGRIVEVLLTRTTVTGLENIPKKSDVPLIFAGNHSSTYDGMLLLIHLPADVGLVGPGDFRLLFPANYIVDFLGVILIHRGTADRDSLKKMTSLLKDGENLIIFPDGGTWEKRLDDVKPGVAYLSMTTGAKIVPISLGGTYQVWGRIFRLKRPRITLHIEPPIGPIASEDRKKRQDDLREASLNLMQSIYDHLPEADQRRFDLHARQRFSGAVEVLPESSDIDLSMDCSVLAELVSKPKLFSPLHRNLKLPLKPLLQSDRFHHANEFLAAVTALHHTFAGDLSDYLDYRLGSKKAAQALQELQFLQMVSQQASEQNLSLRFAPEVTLMDEPLPPNT